MAGAEAIGSKTLSRGATLLHRLILLLIVSTAITGCGADAPFGRGPDPNAADTLAQAEPLITECRQHFVTDRHGTPVTFEGGPTVARDGTLTTIRLEAESAAGAVDPQRYECAFDNGKIGSYGVIH